MSVRDTGREAVALEMAARPQGVCAISFMARTGAGINAAKRMFPRLVAEGKLFGVRDTSKCGPDGQRLHYFLTPAAAEAWQRKPLHEVRAHIYGLKKRHGKEPPVMPRSLDRHRPVVAGAPHKGPPKVTICPPCQVERFVAKTAPRVVDSQQCREWARVL